MSWFNPIKGNYASLDRVEKTLPLKVTTDSSGESSYDKVFRGEILALDNDGTNDEGVFKVAAGTESPLYIALNPADDMQAGMAGIPGAPKITGMALVEGEWETDNYDPSKTYAVGEKLYATNGVLTNTNPGSGTVVGYVTKIPFDRYIDGQEVVQRFRSSLFRQGGYATVIWFTTVK